MGKAQVLLLLLVALAASARAGSVFFLLYEGHTRCFLEDVPADTQLQCRYSLLSENPHADDMSTGLLAWAEEPSGAVVLVSDGPRESSLELMSTTAGEYRFCFKTNSSRWFVSDRFKLYVEIFTGTGVIDYSQVAKTEQLSELEVQIRRANDIIDQIRKEQNYQKEREMAFRATSDTTNSRVKWWALVQFVTLLGCCLFQMVHLRSYFKAIKLY
eukprot:TRINITY_DN8271_c0_g1_i1.p2 TRINITY_DN8271_c0_g1~~TRINITY_DN8271_c0_g1_i1.p2  ORF type:complete len:222 (-),score=86.88 TRINITY_DN8271_c0_g1_i1:82-723(-)